MKYICYGLILITLIIMISIVVMLMFLYHKYSKIKVTKKIDLSLLLEKFNFSFFSLKDSGFSVNFDFKNKTLKLSDGFLTNTVFSTACLIHFLGHICQEEKDSYWLKIHGVLDSFLDFSSKFSYMALLIGFIFMFDKLIVVGFFLFMLIFLIKLIFLPFEFEASKLGLSLLLENKMLTGSDKVKVSKVLGVISCSSLASLLTTLFTMFQKIWFVLINNREGRFDDGC